MSSAGFLKCSCRQCGGHIEFPAAGVGLAIDCPHCGQMTVLAAEAIESPTSKAAEPGPVDLVPEEDSRPRRSVSWSLVAAALLILAAAAGAFLWFQNKPRQKSPANISDAEPARPRPAAVTGQNPSVTEAGTPAAPVAVQSFAPKSIEDLKVGPITLEKGKGTSLVYAVGTLKNNSDFQRFGVKLELDLLDAKGEKVGTAKDYRAVLEPRQDWRFRALVLDNRATLARVASIDEDQ